MSGNGWQEAQRTVADVEGRVDAAMVLEALVPRRVAQVVGGRQEGGVGPSRHEGKGLAQHEGIDVGDDHLKAPLQRLVDQLDLVRPQRLE